MNSNNIRAQDESPGTVIKTYIIDGLGLGIRQLARALDVPANRLYQIINNKREVSIDTAVRLGYFLDMEPSFWLDLQTRHQIKRFQESHHKLKSDIIPFKRGLKSKN